MSRARLLALALGGIMALTEQPRKPRPPVSFLRQETGKWETWPETSMPSPPRAEDAPFEKCYHKHGDCAQWRGVHFTTIRFGLREWDALNGWTGN